MTKSEAKELIKIEAMLKNIVPDVNKRLEELEQYRAIGTIEEFKDLKEKSVAKKVVYSKNGGISTPYCPNCNAELSGSLYLRKFCNCEQKLDWQ